MTPLFELFNPIVQLNYNKNGNMTVLSNPSRIDHGFGYNRVNLNSSYQTPQSGRYRYLYDRARQLLQVDSPSGKQIRNIYDKDLADYFLKSIS